MRFSAACAADCAFCTTLTAGPSPGTKLSALRNIGLVTTDFACDNTFRVAALLAKFEMVEKMSAPAIIWGGIFATPRRTKSLMTSSLAVAVSRIGPLLVRISAMASQSLP